jgi:hypothetical protein
MADTLTSDEEQRPKFNTDVTLWTICGASRNQSCKLCCRSLVHFCTACSSSAWQNKDFGVGPSFVVSRFG